MASRSRTVLPLFSLLLLAALLIAFAMLRTQSDATRWVVHSRDVLECLESTLAAVEGAETGQRGYLLTGDRAFLESYRTASSTLPATLDALAALVADNPRQTRALGAVRSDVTEKMLRLQATIDMQDAGHPGAELATVRAGQDKAIMDRLSVDLASMRAEEARLLAERSRRASQANLLTLATVGAMGALALLLLGLLRTLMLRDAARIRVSEQRLATTVASVGDAVIATDADGRIERMNAVAEHLTGWTQAEATGQPLDTVFRLIDEHSRETVDSPLDKVLRAGKVVGLASHTLLIAKDGTERPIEDSGAPIRALDGSIAGVVLVFKDATERYESERQLRQSDARFRAAVAAMEGVLWTNTAQGEMRGTQAGWAALTGQSYEEYQGYGWSQAVHPEDAQPTIDAWNEAVSQRIPFKFEHRVRRHDGEWRTFSIRAIPILDERGGIREWVGVHTDITEQRAAFASLQEADQRKDEFIATLAHELRNPLAPIRNAVRLLKPELPSSTQAKAREMIERQAAQMANLLDDLLDVSRITRGLIALRLQVLDLRRIVEDVMLAARPLIETLHHDLRVELAGDPLLVEGDPTRLHQLLDNLVQNAAKYTDPGGRIEVSASVRGESVVLAVTDSGIGIDPAAVPRIFDLFSQVHSAERGRSGLGIGLAVVKRIVSLHGGTVEAQSAGIGHGTTFRVTLAKAQRALPSAPPESRPRIAALYRNRPRVLLVDDQPDILESLALLLRAEGYSVHTAEDGVAAAQLCEPLCPDVMVIDIGMPKMDGYDVARWVRQQPWGARTKLIAVTGWGQAADRRRTRDAGFDSHLVKPVDPDALMRMIDGLNGADREESSSR